MSRTISLFMSLFAIVAAANAQVRVTGTLIGQDGKPMPAANVFLTLPTDNIMLKTVTPAPDGNYSMTIDSAGIWLLRFAGVNHYIHDVAVYIDSAEIARGISKPVTIDVRLKGYTYLDTLNDVKVVGDFNKFSFTTAIPMKKMADGTYAVEIETKADSMAYQLVNLESTGRSINGTDAVRYVYDGGGDYKSIVVPKDGMADIIFDPSKLDRTSKEAVVTFGNSKSVTARFAQVYDEMQKNQVAFSDALVKYRASGKDMKDFKHDLSGKLQSLKNRIEKEKVPILRQELMLAYFFVGSMSVNKQAILDSTIKVEALGEISPASVIWSLNPIMVIEVVQYMSDLPQADKDAYIRKLLDENPSAITKSTVLYVKFMNAKMMNDNAKSTRYYNLLTTEYPGTMYGKMVKERFPAVSNLAVGKPVQAFSVVSMADSTKVITNETLKGKYYIMDFWATWCGPCVAEMPNLDKAYKEFKDKNFTILSLLLDTSPADVIAFRKDKWPMPWLHTFIGRGSKSKILKDFEVAFIPKPFLIDPTGKIIAMGDDLRGDKLEKTLEKDLGK